jgi:hypothetical protein
MRDIRYVKIPGLVLGLVVAKFLGSYDYCTGNARIASAVGLGGPVACGNRWSNPSSLGVAGISIE